jgi:hypothetical protein
MSVKTRNHTTARAGLARRRGWERATEAVPLFRRVKWTWVRSGKTKTMVVHQGYMPEGTSGAEKIDRTRRCVAARDQNAPSRIAPTNANTANTASTLSLNARSTSRPPHASCFGAQI